MFAYSITLDGIIVGDNGDLIFDTDKEAFWDADDYILSELAREYNRPAKDFDVSVYLY